MTITLIFLGLVIALIFFFVVKSKIVIAKEVKLADIPAIFNKLKINGKNASFTVFCFGAPVTNLADNGVNVQFSIENGRIGFDWVLISEQNIQDKDRFKELAERLGHKVIACEGNDVKYLRVENGDLPELCISTLRDLYSISPDTDLGLITEGVIWP